MTSFEIEKEVHLGWRVTTSRLGVALISFFRSKSAALKYVDDKCILLPHVMITVRNEDGSVLSDERGQPMLLVESSELALAGSAG